MRHLTQDTPAQSHDHQWAQDYTYQWEVTDPTMSVTDLATVAEPHLDEMLALTGFHPVSAPTWSVHTESGFAGQPGSTVLEARGLLGTVPRQQHGAHSAAA